MIIKNKKELIGLAQNQAEKKLRGDMLAILECALAMSDPYFLVEKFLSQIDCKKYKKIFVVGAGKGAYRMALAAEKFLGAKLIDGCISVPAIIKNGHLKKIKVNLAGHPLPNLGSVIGAQKILEIIKNAGSDDLVLGLFSGGASALMCLPVDKVSLVDKIKVTELLLRSGATIDEMNAVRKHLSLIKGGWLAKAAEAQFTVFYLSDVVGDDLSTVASGPTVADSSTFSDAIKVLSKYSLLNKIPNSVKKYLEDGQNGARQETSKKNSANIKNIIIGSHKTLAKAAFEKAKQLKYQPIIITDEMKGDTEKVGIKFLTRAASGKKKIFIAAGETTFKVRTKNPGGRNQQMCLSVLPKLSNGQVFVAFDSDGVDGVAPEQVGGVIIGAGTLKNVQKLKINIKKTLQINDSYHFFQKVGGLIKTGYVGTNLGDIVLFSK
ncbi:MAG TPA: hypothetical protein DEF57_02420 [Candidatus Magasanikbacteria bacterium]|nr:hypothetical protein [Candidatus Magasanikbacteria bacterium]